MKIPWCCIGRHSLGGVDWKGGLLTGMATFKQAVRALDCLEWFWQHRMSCAELYSSSHCHPFYVQPLWKSSVWQPWHEHLLSGWSLFRVWEKLMHCETCLSSWVLYNFPKWTSSSQILSPPPPTRSRSSLEGAPSSVRFLWIQQSSRDCVSTPHRTRCGCDTETWHHPSSGDTHFPGCCLGRTLLQGEGRL